MTELKEALNSNPYLTDEVKGNLLLKITKLKYIDFGNFRQTIFEVINYVESLRGLQEKSPI